MAKMHAVYYRDADGVEPVDDFIDHLPPRVQASLDLQIDRLNDLRDIDPPLPFPHSSQVEGELRELRCHYGSRLFRVLYRRSQRLFVLLHIFEDDEAGASCRQGDCSGPVAGFQRRMDQQPRSPPRAAGRDAP